jgi:hypothetical protein
MLLRRPVSQYDRFDRRILLVAEQMRARSGAGERGAGGVGRLVFAFLLERRGVECGRRRHCMYFRAFLGT